MSKFVDGQATVEGDGGPEEIEDFIENSQDRAGEVPDDDEEALKDNQTSQEQLAAAGKNSTLPSKALQGEDSDDPPAN